MTTTYQRLFQQKETAFVLKTGLFGLFPGDKGDYTDVWMIKTAIKTNLYMNVCFFQRNITYKTIFVLIVCLSTIGLLVC